MTVIKNGSVVFVSTEEKLELLRRMDRESLFLNLAFFNGLGTYGHLSNRYIFYLKDKYSINPDLAKRMSIYLDYIEDKTYHSSRLGLLAEIRTRLIENGLFVPLKFDKYENRKIYSVSEMPVPRFFNKNIENIIEDDIQDNEITLIRTEDSVSSAKAVYKTIVALLEKNINPENIVILNATAADEYHLAKLFNDAKIPFHSDKGVPMSKHPQALKLIRILLDKGYMTFRENLNLLSEGPLKVSIIKVVNRYSDFDLQKNPSLLADILKLEIIKSIEYSGTISSLGLDKGFLNTKKHCLLMNYTDSSLVRYRKYHDYLNEAEIEEIGYPSLDSINDHLETKVIRLLETIEELTLFFPKTTEQENRLPNLNIKRNVKQKDYADQVDRTSYLKELDILEYAKARYQKEKYSLEREDFSLLENTHKENVMQYNHDFTGINDVELQTLLARKNTLTGAKIESYNLCRFQYLLKYLLGMSEMVKSTSQFLGSVTHKVFDEASKHNRVDIENITAFHLEFPESENYKEKVYRKALAKELKVIVPLFLEFHRKTGFNLIEAEIPFKIPYDDFFLTGTIDKAMVLKTNTDKDYFILVDYKLNDKDFKLEEFEKGLMLQLPVYMYAYIKLKGERMTPAGLFYQKTGIGRYKLHRESIADSFRLSGVALESKSVMETLDGDLSHLKGISIKLDGEFAKSNRILKNSEFIKMISGVERQINSAIANIKNGDFAIDPLPSHGHKKDSISCEYCEFAHICFNKNKGLGGDEE